MNKNETTKTTPEVAALPAPASPAIASPVIEMRGKKGKKKRKYSRGLKEVQQTTRGLTKANRRIARAIATGFTEFYRRDDASSRKKRDGSIRDAVKNWSLALGKVMRRSSDAPYDLAKAFDTKFARRAVRDAARLFGRAFVR